MAQAAGKPVIAYTDSQATSAAYALAAACNGVVCSDTAVLGSIGVIAIAVETSVADAMAGVRWTVITSGERKADGHPNVPMTDATRAALQTGVDAMAGVFFGLIQEFRGIDAEPMQAATFIGQSALAADLADEVMSLDSLLALLRAGNAIIGLGEMPKFLDAKVAAASADDDDKKDNLPKADDDMGKDKLRSALQSVADDEDADEKMRARAKRALAAYDSDEEAKADDSDGDGDEAKAEDEAKAAAQSDVTSILARTVQSLGRQVAALNARHEESERGALFAGRPDLDPQLVQALSASSLAECKRIVAAIPKPSAELPAPKAGAVGPVSNPKMVLLGRQPTRGPTPLPIEEQGSAAPASPRDRLPDAEELKVLMGITPLKTGIRQSTYKLELGVPGRPQDAATAAENK
jgi:ClpP class serine protease